LHRRDALFVAAAVSDLQVELGPEGSSPAARPALGLFIKLSIGVALLAAIRSLIPERSAESGSRRVDVLGAVTVTAATGALIYGVINAGQYGWTDPGTLEPIAARIVTTFS